MPGARNPYNAIRPAWETCSVPETRLERVFATIGLVAVIALTAVVVVGLRDYRREGTASRSGQVASADVSATTSTPSAALAAGSTLVVTAARGNCWLEIHASSSQGDVLYEGVLTRGDARTFTGKKLWIRLGAAQNLDVTLNGRRVDNLPEGTADVLVTLRGIQPAIS
jgi:hypothetical protein